MIDGREEPSEEEVRHYYDGLFSEPWLFARSGTDSWPPAPPPFSAAEAALHRNDPVPPPWTPGATKKSLGPISGPFSDEQHALVTAWPELRDMIITSLNGSPIKDCWTIFYPTRITTDWVMRGHHLRHEACKTSRVTLLVGVGYSGIQEAASSMDTKAWAIAMVAVTKLQQILDDRGIADVRVEAYEAEVFPLAGSPESDSNAIGTRGSTETPGLTSEGQKSQNENQHDIEHLFEIKYMAKAMDLNPSNVIVDRFTSIPMKILHYPGQILERTTPASTKDGGDNYEKTGSTGSLGLYLAIGPQTADPQNSTGKVFALTSRHVAVDNNLDANITYRYHAEEGESGKKGKIIVLWGEERALQLAASELEEIGSRIGKIAQAKMKRISDADDFDSDAIETSFECADKYLPALSQAIKHVANDSYSASGDPNSKRREVGHVVLSAKHGNTPQLAWSDWALIELNDTSAAIVRGRRRPNKISAGPVRARWFYTRIEHLHPSVKDRWLTLFNQYNFVNIQGTRLPGTLKMDEDEPAHPAVQDTKGKAPDAHPRTFPATSEWVFKRGPATDFTMGLTNEVEAVVRKPLKDDKHRVAYSLLIYPTATDLAREVIQAAKFTFSDRGDSGSAVVGLDGRVVAMIDAGVSRSQLGRLFRRPPSVLPATDDEIESAATAALAAAEQTTVTPGFRPATGSAIPGQGDLTDSDMDVTLATPIDWVLEEIEATLGQPVHLL